MKAKQKAKELYDRFIPIVRQSDLYDTYHNKAKECANICVNEVLDLGVVDKASAIVYKYYSEVKIEISKL